MGEPMRATSTELTSVQKERGPLSGHQPLVLILAAFCTGIIFDRFAPWTTVGYFCAAIAFWMCWLVAFRLGRHHLSSVLLLLACLCAGGAWHHYRWSLYPADDLGFSATQDLRPVCVEAVALKNPRRSPAPPPNPLRAMQLGEQSSLSIKILRVRDGRKWQRAAGRASLTVEGRLTDVRAGDQLRVFALFHAPAPSRNPGDFDFAEFLRSRRQLCQLHGDGPDCLSVLKQGSGWHPRRLLNGVRTRGKRLLWRYIDRDQAGLASAVLLGAREQVEDEQTEEFFTTGTIHLLAISGLHVGILASLFWSLGRLNLISRRAMFLSIGLFVTLYAVLTESRPPVMRATVLIVALCTARHLGRQAFSFNTLALAGLVVLAWNPAQLFRAGTQLSFLAVATLACCAGMFVREPPRDPLKRLIQETRPASRRALRGVGGWIYRLWLTSTIIWLVALPLVMHRFHLVTPIAVVLNPLLLIPIGVALFSGLSVLVFGNFLPPVAEIGGGVCGLSLSAIEQMIQVGRPITGSHFWTPGPEAWWVIGFYAILAAAVFARNSFVPRRWCVAAISLWAALGFMSSHQVQAELKPESERQLACTIVSVGHGNAVVLELPEGQTILYDAGRLGSPHAGVRAICSVLWSSGITHLDAVVLSHADIDHYNALPELFERISVGVVYVSPLMFQEGSEALILLRNSIREADVPLRHLTMGDRLDVGSAVSIEALHPPRRGALGFDSDNANSIVLLVGYEGRRILLPGDLVSPGLDDVLAEEPVDCDVVMAPHHGSAIGSDPQRFAAWSTPEWVVISAGQNDRLAPVKRIFREAGARVLHTQRSGAVRVTITTEELTVQGWRLEPW